MSNQIEGPSVNSFLMTMNLAQAVPGLCMNVLGARVGVFLEPFLQIGAFSALHKRKPSA